MAILKSPSGLSVERVTSCTTLPWIRETASRSRQVTSVCTGALLLAKIGLLQGKRATTHWAGLELLASIDPTIQVQRDRRVVHDGIFTSAGVSAGIDMGLHLVGLTHGQDVAEAIQLGIEYDPQPPYDAGAPSKARPEIRELVEAVMTSNEASAGDAARSASTSA